MKDIIKERLREYLNLNKIIKNDDLSLVDKAKKIYKLLYDINHNLHWGNIKMDHIIDVKEIKAILKWNSYSSFDYIIDIFAIKILQNITENLMNNLLNKK